MGANKPLVGILMTIVDVTVIIIHWKYFPVSDWLKPHAWFTITSCCGLNIEPMSLKVQPAANCWTNDIKMTSKVQPAADYWTVDQENLGTRLCHFGWAEKQRAKWRNSFKKVEYFEWIINQLLYSAFVRILQILEGVIHRIRALLDLQNYSYPTLPASLNNCKIFDTIFMTVQVSYSSLSHLFFQCLVRGWSPTAKFSNFLKAIIITVA